LDEENEDGGDVVVGDGDDDVVVGDGDDDVVVGDGGLRRKLMLVFFIMDMRG